MKELNEIVRKYSNRGKLTNIAIGLRPSGIIHLGNMASLALAGIVGQGIGPHLSRVTVTVCDLDMPDRTDWPIREKKYVKYFGSLPDSQGCHPNLLQHSRYNLEHFLSDLEGHLGVDFFVQNLSEIQRDGGFRKGLKRVLDDPEIMQFIIPGKIPEGNVLVYPICRECGTSSPYFTKYANGILSTSCTNPNCEVGEYSMDVEDTSRDLAVHFFIDPLRDKTVEPNADVHVFGGDYRDEHGKNRLTKSQKILRIIGLATEGETPDFLIGPKIYARDGDKMSKSKNNGLSLELLRDHLGEDYVKRVADFTRELTDEEFKHIDYPVIEKRLLSRAQ